MGLLITFFLGIFLLVGAMIARSVKNTALIEQISISIALGTMAALALDEILPEALENLEGRNYMVLAVCVLLGVAILKSLDHFIPEHDHEHGLHHDCTEKNVIHIGIVSTIAVILHNIIEGMAVYSIAQQDVTSGTLMAIGVGLHNIPMGMVIYSTLQKEKRTPKLLLLGSAALSTFIGGLLMKFLWGSISEYAIGLLLGLTLGMIVYIVVLELLPHLLHGKKKGLSLAGVVLGVLLILFCGLFE
jgi:ZIP family zinc transporter